MQSFEYMFPFLLFFFSNSFFSSLFLVHTHTGTHTHAPALCIISSSYGIALRAQGHVNPPSFFFLYFSGERSAACFCRVPALFFLSVFLFPPSPFLPCPSVSLTCRSKRNFWHLSLLWCFCSRRYRRTSTDSVSYLLHLRVLSESARCIHRAHGNRNVAPSPTPTHPPGIFCLLQKFFCEASVDSRLIPRCMTALSCAILRSPFCCSTTRTRTNTCMFCRWAWSLGRIRSLRACGAIYW